MYQYCKQKQILICQEIYKIFFLFPTVPWPEKIQKNIILLRGILLLVWFFSYWRYIPFLTVIEVWRTDQQKKENIRVVQSTWFLIQLPTVKYRLCFASSFLSSGLFAEEYSQKDNAGSCNLRKPKTEFLNEIQTKVLKIFFPLLFTVTSTALPWDFYFPPPHPSPRPWAVSHAQKT